MHLLLPKNVMLDFICMGPVELPGVQNKLKLQKEKILSTVGFEPSPGRAAPDYESIVLST